MGNVGVENNDEAALVYSPGVTIRAGFAVVKMVFWTHIVRRDAARFSGGLFLQSPATSAC